MLTLKAETKLEMNALWLQNCEDEFATIFALITIHDAVKVRGESGKQAKIVNQLVADFTGMYEMMNLKTPVERTEKLKELIGHTTAEVFGGLVSGIIIALIYISVLNV